MFIKKILIFLTLFIILLSVSHSISPEEGIISSISTVSESSKIATITVVANSGSLITNTPIIIDTFTFNSLDVSIATAIIKDGLAELPTQYDEELNELVFQLPSPIRAGDTKTFDLYADTTGTDNGQLPSINMGQGIYSETYDAWLPPKLTSTFMNGTKPTNYVRDIGEVVWVETDWGIMCLSLESSWRQSTMKHLILKQENWDVINANYNASRTEWRWGSAMYQDADPGWQYMTGKDTLAILKVGPVRAVVQIVSNTDWHSLIGISVQNLNATKTFIMYNGLPGISQHFSLTGENASQAHVDFSALYLGDKFGMKHQGIDAGTNYKGSNNFTSVYAPGEPIKDRNIVGQFDLSKLTNSYFAFYNDSNYGYVYNWGPFSYLQNVTKIEWSNYMAWAVYYSFDYFPEAGINRYLIPFLGSAVLGDVTEYADMLNAQWTRPKKVLVNVTCPECVCPGAAGTSKVASIKVVARSGTLIAYTPIIIDISSLSSLDIALGTAVIKDGSIELMTQYDEELNELVFQLPSSIRAGDTKTFDLYADTTGTDNGQPTSINMDQGIYSETYDAWLPSRLTSTFMNGTELTNQVQGVGEVVWVETDWGIMCLSLESPWRQSTMKHLILKEENWDVINAYYNASRSEWRWGSAMYQDVNPGWEHETGKDTLAIVKVGPVRAVVQIVSNTNWHSLIGISVQNLNATKTYIMYNGLPGISQHISLTGKNATQAHVDFSSLYFGDKFGMKHQGIDAGTNNKGTNNFTNIYAPGEPIKFRPIIGQFDLSEIGNSYFAFYNDSSYGYVYNWGPFSYLQNITKIEWSDYMAWGVHYSFDYFPEAGIDRYLIPFLGSAVLGNVAEYSDLLNAQWTMPKEVIIGINCSCPPCPTTTEQTTSKEHETTSEEEATSSIPKIEPIPGFSLLIVCSAAIFMIIHKRSKKVN